MAHIPLQSASALVAVLLGLSTVGCADSATSPVDTDEPEGPDRFCSISQDEIFGGGPGRDGIPALTNPAFVQVGESGHEYLEDHDRVVGLVFDGGPMAIPLNILWWHEIVNLDVSGEAIAVTHCPLTGSSLAFDRAAVGGAEFGVSGLLYRNNLIMYDRTASESLWPQMSRGARCGPSRDLDLPMVPIVEMTWAGWKALHPETLVVSGDTGHSSNYRIYPYGGYDALHSTETFFPTDLDGRRPPKERVLGFPGKHGARVFAYGLLDGMGATAAVPVDLDGTAAVVFWDREKDAAMAFESVLGEESLTFTVSNGEIIDANTGSHWSVDGFARGGPLEGQRLRPVAEAFVAYWFAWPEFFSDVQIWNSGPIDSSPVEMR